MEGRINRSLFPVSSRHSLKKDALDMLAVSNRLAEQELVGQLFSAFCSSARKNFAAVFGGHSLSESVLFLSLKLLWLIGSEHSLSPSLQDETLQNRIIDKISPKVKRGPAFFFLPVF